MRRSRAIVRATANWLTRPSHPIPLIFALTVGLTTGTVTAIAMLLMPAGRFRAGLLAALVLPDVVLVGVAALVAAGLVSRTTRGATQFSNAVDRLAAEGFEAGSPPPVSFEYQQLLNRIWSLGRNLTARERQLAGAAREWERRYIESRELIDIFADINHALGMNSVLNAVARGLSRFFAGDAVAIWLYQPEGNLVLAVEVGGNFPRQFTGREEWVQAVVTGSGRLGPVLIAGGVAALTTPLLDAKNELIGIVVMNSAKRTGYTFAEIGFFHAVVAHAPLAIQNGISYDQRDALSRLDSLTGLQNRREFDRLMAIETERARRYQQPVSLLMIDIDHFKRVNDSRGHPAGDWALQQIGILIQQMRIRSSDCAFRLGGEEFAILLTQTDKQGAMTVAERLRELTVLHQLFSDGTGVTISIGVANYPADVTEPAQLLNRADKALYEAKQSGRNRVVAAS